MMIAQAVRLVQPVSVERDHVRGPDAALVTLVEYGDYECPHCRAAYPVIDEIVGAMKNDALFAYRHFPLTQTHPHGMEAAQAAELAGSHGLFWEMHDMLFSHQDALATRDLVQYAARLGLDPAPFARALAARSHAARVREDFVSGVRSGVNGTPTFFVDGFRYDGPRDFQSLMAALDEAARRNAGQQRVR
jgi:protein-disulfide isomerase